MIARRVEELQDRFGADRGDAVRATRARRLRAAHARLRSPSCPTGRYEGSFAIDSDGVDARTYDVRAAVTVCDDGTVDVDLAARRRRPAARSTRRCRRRSRAIVYAIRCFADPTIPMNEGCFRPLRVHLPRGSLVNPDPPAACGGRLVTVAAATEAILQALARAAPDRAVAASSLIQVYALSGAHPDGTTWLTLLYEFGGLGARAGADGPDATGAFFLGGRSVIPQVEPLRGAVPVRRPLGPPAPRLRGRGDVARRPRRRDRDRAARRRAAHRARRPHRDVSATGRRGGEPGRPGSFSVERVDGRVEQLASAPGRRAARRGRPIRAAHVGRRRAGPRRRP